MIPLLQRRGLPPALAALLTGATLAGGSVPEGPPVAAIFDVRAFGARGDGTTDDLPAAAEAVAAVRAAGGGVVAFPAGVYRFGSGAPLRLDGDDLTLLGEPGAVIRASLGTQMLLRSEGARRLRIRGLTFEGTVGGTRGITMQLRGCSDCEISGCLFERIGTSAIDVTDGSIRCRLAGNTLRRPPGHGIMISGWASATDPARGSSFVEVADNLIEQPGNSGISIEVRNDHVVVRGNRILGANRNRSLYSDGIAVFNGTTDYEILDNVVVGTLPARGPIDTGNGILLGHGENRTPPLRGLLRGNLLLGNGHAAGQTPPRCPADDCRGNGILIAIGGEEPTPLDTRVEGNVVVQSGRSGISVSGASGLLLRDNRVDGSRNQGIWLDASAPGNHLAGNFVTDSANHGLRIDSAGSTVAGNQALRNGLSGIFLGSAANSNVVARNLAWDNNRARHGHAEIFLDGTETEGASNNLLAGNRLAALVAGSSSQAAGIRIHSASCRDNLLAANLPEGKAAPSLVDLGSGTRITDIPVVPVEICVIGPEDPATLRQACGWARLAGNRMPSRIEPCDPDQAGRFLSLLCGDEPTILEERDGNFRLASPFTCAAGAALTLVCDGTAWEEVSREGVE